MDSPERKATNVELPKKKLVGADPRYDKFLAGPHCGEDAVAYMLDEVVCGGAAELASGERVPRQALLS